MPRDELLRRLGSLDPLTPAACLVLLWTYFEDDRVGLPAVEALVRFRWRDPQRLPEYDQKGLSQERLAAAREDLRTQKDPGEFDLLALRWLKSLDLLLNEDPFQDCQSDQLLGIDGKTYSVRSRNAFLARYYEDHKLPVRSVAHEGLSLTAYCRHFMPVPSLVKGMRIEIKSSWGSPHLHNRLQAERESLKILLWPFRTPPDYPGLDKLNAANPPKTIVLDEIRNEPALQEEVRQALEVARAKKVTLLLFPELSIPPATERTICQALAQHGVDGHPILTLLGCCHRPNDQGDRHLNEAVVLGPDGSELHRHLKLVPYTASPFKGPIPEDIACGTAVTILEAAFGNLTPLICIDLLNDEIKEALRRSHANLFLVPSMSEETKAHQHAAMTLQLRARASTFVCNRWMPPLSEESTSFFRIPRQEGLTLHFPFGLPYLLFEL